MNRQAWLDVNGDPKIENWHDFYLCQVTDVIENGLHPAHKGDVYSWLCDLNIGDVPWDEAQFQQFASNLLEDTRFEQLQQKFEEKFGRLFWEELDEERVV